MAKSGEYLITGGLPAEEFRLIGNDFMINTPVDDRGLVDISEHIRLVKMTLSPDINWINQTNNIHHFYWPAHIYNNSDDNQTKEIKFRNLPVHKGLIPVQFHNWMHRISIPPEIPSAEVIDYRLESWFVADKLFQAVRQYKRQDRSLRKHYLNRSNDSEIDDMETIEKELVSDLYIKFFDKYPKLHDKLFQIPKEFRLVDPEKSFDQLNKDLGKIAGSNALTLKRLVTL